MSDDDRENLVILAALLLFIIFVFPATWRMYDDAEAHSAVDQAFVAHGVRVER